VGSVGIKLDRWTFGEIATSLHNQSSTVAAGVTNQAMET
jgi:hypothetical protein